MQSINATRFPIDKVMAVLQGIALFPAMQRQVPEAIAPLMQSARFVVADAGEAIMHRGEFDSSFYFLLKGKLLVSTGDEDNVGKTVSFIQPGEMFGALAILRDAERSATLQVSENGRAILFGIDAAPFGELDDFSQVSLPVKILFLRWVVECTQQRLQAYESEMPGSDLGTRLLALPSFNGVRDSVQELQFLYERANELADLLGEWNLTLENIENYHPVHGAPAGDLLTDLEKLYFG